MVVSIDGVLQVAPDNYSVSGTTLTFTEAPSASSNVAIKHLGFRTTATVTEVPSDSISDTELTDTAVTPGTYGGEEQIPVITVNQKGRITSAANVTVSAPLPNILMLSGM